eukprot:5228279-Pyramimonas_sp.AAC.1
MERLSKGYGKAIKRLSKGYQKAIKRILKGYRKAIKRLSKRLSKGYEKKGYQKAIKKAIARRQHQSFMLSSHCCRQNRQKTKSARGSGAVRPQVRPSSSQLLINYKL